MMDSWQLLVDARWFTVNLFIYIFIYPFIYLVGVYVTFNSQGHVVPGSLQVEETSAHCIVNLRASASYYQLSNMKCPAQDSNQRPQRVEARTLPLHQQVPLVYSELETCHSFHDSGLLIHQELSLST